MVGDSSCVKARWRTRAVCHPIPHAIDFCFRSWIFDAVSSVSGVGRAGKSLRETTSILMNFCFIASARDLDYGSASCRVGDRLSGSLHTVSIKSSEILWHTISAHSSLVSSEYSFASHQLGPRAHRSLRRN
jgi:hypothetical protein